MPGNPLEDAQIGVLKVVNAIERRVGGLGGDPRSKHDYRCNSESHQQLFAIWSAGILLTGVTQDLE